MVPMCGLLSSRCAVSGSSSTACTPSQYTSHAATGSSSTDGPSGNSMPAPAERKPGNHSIKCRTTSRADHSATGDGTSHDDVPRTRSVNNAAISRCRSAGTSDSAIADHPLELRVTLVDADVHAALQPRVARLEAVDEHLRAEPRPAVAEIVEPQRIQRDAIRITCEREGLHDAVGPHVVETAAEAVLLPGARRDVPPAAAGRRVPVLDPGSHRVGT